MSRQGFARTKSSILVLIGLIALAIPGTGFAEGEVCQVIRITQEKGGGGKFIQINPEMAKVSKGTCVIWVNWVPESQIRVTFKESAKACMRATDAPSGFKEIENCYLSEYIPLGKTVSLHFKEAGTFKYQVEVPDTTKFTPAGINPGKIEGSGEIQVE